jgi:hypothetical protein
MASSAAVEKAVFAGLREITMMRGLPRSFRDWMVTCR